MKNKEVLFIEDYIERFKKGVDTIGFAVGGTLGPNGRRVILSRKLGAQHVSKDGVTVAKEINVSDPVGQVAVQMIKEAAAKTNDFAGDGTTTATILAREIFMRGYKMITAGANRTLIVDGINMAVDCVVKYIASQAIDVNDDFDKIYQVAKVSSNNDESIASMIKEGYEKVGVDGLITVKASKNHKSYLVIEEGMKFDRGWVNPYFIKDPRKMNTVFQNPRIIVCAEKLSNVNDFFPLLQLAQNGKANGESNSVVIIAPKVEGAVMNTLMTNVQKGTLDVCVIPAPGFGENQEKLLDDIALRLNCKVINGANSNSLKNAVEAKGDGYFGTCDSIEINQSNTVIVGSPSYKSTKEFVPAYSEEELKKRIEDQIASLTFERSQTKDDHLIDGFNQRIASLRGVVAVIYQGALTTTELLENKDRVEDALRASKSAIEEGVVYGAGIIYINALKELEKLSEGLSEDEKMGIKVVSESISTPIQLIAEHGNDNGGMVLAKIIESNGTKYYDARDKTYKDVENSSILDAAKVSRVALENAASVSTQILLSGTIIIDAAEEN